MIILHASWLNRALHLWAEQKIDGSVLPSKRPGRKLLIPVSPFDTGIQFLWRASEALPIPLKIKPERIRQRIALLPTVDGAPVGAGL
jgi:hypothetical protein